MKVTELEKDDKLVSRVLARMLKEAGFKDTNDPDSKTWMALCAKASAEVEKEFPSSKP